MVHIKDISNIKTNKYSDMNGRELAPLQTRTDSVSSYDADAYIEDDFFIYIVPTHDPMTVVCNVANLNEISSDSCTW